MSKTVKAPQFNINTTPHISDDQKLDTPTVRYRDKPGWLICNTSLGCGSRVLQGWSSGVGIDYSNNTEFERKLFHLLYLSTHHDYTKDCWGTFNTGKTTEAPIGVSLERYQFLENGRTYTLNSTADWVARFEGFVNKHSLGTFTKSHPWRNLSWHKGDNVTAVWTWNGAVPKAADVGITDWKLPE